MKTTTTKTAKKTKVQTAEQIETTRLYERDLEQSISSLVQRTLRMRAIGEECQFHGDGVEHDKRRVGRKINDLLARRLIKVSGSSTNGPLYVVTRMAETSVAPPLDHVELDALLVRALDDQMRPLMSGYDAFRDTWRSPPAVAMMSLPFSAQRTILMYPSLVTVALCQFEQHGYGTFMPFQLGEKIPDLGRSSYRRFNVDSIFVSRPAVGARWRKHVTTALRTHVTTSPEVTASVLGRMLGMTTKEATDVLAAARCARDHFMDSKTLFDKKKPGEWCDVLREEIAYADNKMRSLAASRAEACVLLGALSAIENVDKKFYESVEHVVEDNTKFIP